MSISPGATRGLRRLGRNVYTSMRLGHPRADTRNRVFAAHHQVRSVLARKRAIVPGERHDVVERIDLGRESFVGRDVLTRLDPMIARREGGRSPDMRRYEG